MVKPMQAESGTQKLDVLLGVYRNRVLGETFRYSDLKEANVNGRYWERMGYLTVIRCGVKQLPDIYPYKD